MNETVVQNEQLRRYVETHHIDMIPAGARHGKPWQQAARILDRRHCVVGQRDDDLPAGDGLLAAARVYDDVEAPVGRP